MDHFKVMEYLYGNLAEDMKAILLTEISMGTEREYGVMGQYGQGSLKMINPLTEKEYGKKMETRYKVYGKTES